MTNLSQLPPLSLYVHIPWCVKKCPYCDFNSHQLKADLPEEAYISALLKDLELTLPLFWGRTINSIFIGGGTPSLFNPKALERLLTGVRNLTRLSPFAEITLEANPGTVDNAYLSAYAQIGINRISLGIQSFDDTKLKILGRIHDSRQAKIALDLALKYFPRVNIDLMYGLPQQTIADALSDLDIATAAQPQHISCYNLTIEQNTAFYQNPPAHLPDVEACSDIEDAIVAKLAQYGYARYEVSAYAQKGHACQHNLNYWQFGDYLGIGAGAHAKISLPDKIIRQVRQKHPNTYMQDVLNSNELPDKHIIENKIVPSNELPFEFMLNALRLKDGFATALFVERTGLGLHEILPQINTAVERQLITLDQGTIKPTKSGYAFLNDLMMLFL